MEYLYPRARPEMGAGQLSEEIKAALGYDTRIRIDPKTVKVWFEKTLTDAEKVRLDELVAKHKMKPPKPWAPEELELMSPDGTIWKLKVDDQGKVKVEK